MRFWKRSRSLPVSPIARFGETLCQTEWRKELLKTGIGGKNGAYIRFRRLEPLPGFQFLHAESETYPADSPSESTPADAP